MHTVRHGLRIAWAILFCGFAGCSLHPLEDAINRGKTPQALDLIDRGKGLGEVDSYDQTPLHWAAQRDDAEIAKLLIAKGESVDARDRWVKRRSLSRPIIAMFRYAGSSWTAARR